MLYISDVPLDYLGVSGPPGQEPLPDLTEAWLDNVPPITVGMTLLMAGPFWIIKRRMRLAEEKISDSEGESLESGPRTSTEDIDR